MQSTEGFFQPASLEEAINFLIEENKESLKDIKAISEDSFVGSCHHGLGTALRNEWHLWWNEIKGLPNVPKEIPKLVQYFNELNIFHGDDMSGIIFTSTYRKIAGLDLDLEGQVKKYLDFWLAEGFDNGIYLVNTEKKNI